MTSLSPESLKPRISRLESLEATMASIEVSLSGDPHQQLQPRRKMSQKQQQQQQQSTTNQVSSNNKPGAGGGEQRKLHDVNLTNDKMTKLLQEMETLRQGLSKKDVLISDLRLKNQALQEQFKENGHHDMVGFQNDTISSKLNEIQQKKERLLQIERETDNKRVAIKNLQLTMDKVEPTDLDARIRQAEMEFQLEREELSILNLQQEQIAIKTFLEEKANENVNQNSTDGVSFFSLLGDKRNVSMVAVEVPYNPQTPNFIISAHPSGQGLFVQWARDNSSLQKGDRLLEVNGNVVLAGTRENLVQIMSSATTTAPLHMTVLRCYVAPPVRHVNAREMESLKDEIASVVKKLDLKIRENKELSITSEKFRRERDKLQSDNLKMTHRIAFLEEQVTELQQSWDNLRITLNQVDLKTEKGFLRFQDNNSSTIASYNSFTENQINCSSNGKASSNKMNANNHNVNKVALKGTTSIVVNRSSAVNNGVNVVRTNSTGGSSVSSSSSGSSSERYQTSFSPVMLLPTKPVASSIHSNRTFSNVSQTQVMNTVNTALSHAMGGPIRTTKSSSLSSVPSLLVRTSSTVSVGTPSSIEAQQRTLSSGVNLVGSSIVKSQSIGQLDRLKEPSNEYRHHILQVHVPFAKPAVTKSLSHASSGTTTFNGFTPLTRSASATCPPTSHNSSFNRAPTPPPKNTFRLHKDLELKRSVGSEASDPDTSILSGPLAIHLKMNNTKIALDDFESDNEEWC